MYKTLKRGIRQICVSEEILISSVHEIVHIYIEYKVHVLVFSLIKVSYFYFENWGGGGGEWGAQSKLPNYT